MVRPRKRVREPDGRGCRARPPRPGLGRRCRTASRPAGRRTRSGPPARLTEDPALGQGGLSPLRRPRGSGFGGPEPRLCPENGAEHRGRITWTDCTHGPRGQRQPFSRRERRLHPFSVPSIIHREDVEFLGRKPETGGTPTPPGVEFVRYRRSCGLESRRTASKTPRMDMRTVFRARRIGGGGQDAGHPSRPEARLQADPQALAGHDQAPGWPVRRESCPAGPSATTGQR